jgi:uncharacterized protein YebE (UPF0316 family)
MTEVMEFLNANPWAMGLAIFLARVADVSVGTVRTILVFRGRRFLAAGLGFIEGLIWLGAAAQVLQNLSEWYLAFAYAAGFAAGNIAGIWLEGKLAIGAELIRIISKDTGVRVAEELRATGHSVTEFTGRGDDGLPVEVLFVVEKRRRVRSLLLQILAIDPKAVCTTSDIKLPSYLPRPNLPILDIGGDPFSVVKRK